MTGQPEVTASGAGAAAVGGDNTGIIATGPGAQFHLYSGRPPVSWPHRVGVVPSVAAGYLARTDLAAGLERVFGEASGTAVLTGVVSGMGGVGKTQLAAAYAHRAWDAGGVELLVWLTATSRDAVLTGYAQAGADVAHPPEGEDTEQVARRFLAWLAATDKRWLVVLDDLADPADLKGLWPQGRTGRVLVTTRRRDAALADRGTVVEVDLFTLDEALAYLAGRLNPDGRHPDRLAEAGELAEDLGRLPLALAEAAAYMRDRELACAGYRRRLARRRLELALPADAAAGDYAGTVAGTWSLSVELADRLSPAGLARPLLTLAALLDPHGIPTAVFSTDAVRAYLAAPEDAETPSPANLPPPGLLRDEEPALSAADEDLLDEDLQDVLGNLHRLSLISLTRDGDGTGSVRVHALVQRATREQASPVLVDAAARAAADALLQAWPERDYQPEHVLLAQSLRDNTDALAAIDSGSLWTPQAHQLLFRAGRSRTDGGLLGQAVAYWATLTATAEQVLGPDHPDTLASRHSLAGAYWAAGRLGEALPLYERTLADRERLLGKFHPHTLLSRGNLAGAYQDAGRLDQALPLLKRTLADRERILGADHPATLASRNNLAAAYHVAGRLEEALPLLERTLADYEQILGADHPSTLTSRNNLAYAYQDAGRLEEALPLLERTLADRERILGADHPSTLTSRNNLAYAYQDAGRLAEAAPLFERTLADAERILGPEHPDTLTSRNSLAAAYRDAGRLVEALPLLERTLADRERILGADHLNTLASRNSLALAYQNAGCLEAALPLYEQAAAGIERVRGSVHPQLAVTLYRLGQAQAELGDLAAAAAALGRAVEVDTGAYGPDHPEVATDLDALAAVQEQQGNLDGAVATRTRAQRIREQQARPAEE